MPETRWWMSFIGDATRGVLWPPPEGMLGSWCTGWDSDDKPVIVCWTQAPTEEAARAIAAQSFPESAGREFRFCGVVEHDWRPNDRFPLSDWMEERLDAPANTEHDPLICRVCGKTQFLCDCPPECEACGSADECECS